MRLERPSVNLWLWSRLTRSMGSWRSVLAWCAPWRIPDGYRSETKARPAELLDRWKRSTKNSRRRHTVLEHALGVESLAKADSCRSRWCGEETYGGSWNCRCGKWGRLTEMMNQMHKTKTAAELMRYGSLLCPKTVEVHRRDGVSSNGSSKSWKGKRRKRTTGQDRPNRHYQRVGRRGRRPCHKLSSHFTLFIET